MVAAANAAQHANIEDVRECKNAFLSFLNAKNIDYNEYAHVDRAFHSQLIEMSQNSALQCVDQTILLLPKAFASGFMRSPNDTVKGHWILSMH